MPLQRADQGCQDIRMFYQIGNATINDPVKVRPTLESPVDKVRLTIKVRSNN